MQAVTEGDVRIYVVFPAQEYEGLAEMALGEQRDLRDQVRACVRAEAGRFRQRQWLAQLTGLRRQIEAQAGGALDKVFGELCVLDDVATALGLLAWERQQMLGEAVTAWLDGPVPAPTEAGLAFGSNGHGAGEKGVILINGHGSETHGNGHRTALAGTGKGTRQG